VNAAGEQRAGRQAQGRSDKGAQIGGLKPASMLVSVRRDKAAIKPSTSPAAISLRARPPMSCMHVDTMGPEGQAYADLLAARCTYEKALRRCPMDARNRATAAERAKHHAGERCAESDPLTMSSIVWTSLDHLVHGIQLRIWRAEPL